MPRSATHRFARLVEKQKGKFPLKKTIRKELAALSFFARKHFRTKLKEKKQSLF
jgi:hypothetical protein